MLLDRDTNKYLNNDITEYLDKYQNKYINKYNDTLVLYYKDQNKHFESLTGTKTKYINKYILQLLPDAALALLRCSPRTTPTPSLRCPHIASEQLPPH